MVFVTAGMGGGTGTGAAPVVARAAKEMGILTVGVVTKPFHFEGVRRMKFAEAGINELQGSVDTQIIIPNQNLFRVANEKTTFADAFAMADQVLYSGVACITDLMVKEGLINLDFADVRAVMREMGKAMMGTGEASGEKRAMRSAEAAIANPLIDDVSMKGARGLLISITGGRDLTLYEVDEAATRIREEVDQDANIIVGATFDESLEGIIRVSVVATGIDHVEMAGQSAPETRVVNATGKIHAETRRMTEQHEQQQAAPAPRANAAPPAAPRAAIEQAAAAAVEAALRPQPTAEDVTIRPMAPKPSLFMEPQAPEEQQAAPENPQRAFIPPQPERPTSVRTPRMPRIDELPMPAQNQIRANRGELPEEHPEKRRMTLLQRLASVGLGRREDAELAHEPPQLPMPAPRPPAPQQRQEPVSDYARRPVTPTQPAHPQAGYPQQAPAPRAQAGYPQQHAPQGLDIHGRPVPAHKAGDDDQLEIPAFLRRQAN